MYNGCYLRIRCFFITVKYQNPALVRLGTQKMYGDVQTICCHCTPGCGKWMFDACKYCCFGHCAIFGINPTKTCYLTCKSRIKDSRFPFNLPLKTRDLTGFISHQISNILTFLKWHEPRLTFCSFIFCLALCKVGKVLTSLYAREEGLKWCIGWVLLQFYWYWYQYGY